MANSLKCFLLIACIFYPILSPRKLLAENSRVVTVSEKIRFVGEVEDVFVVAKDPSDSHKVVPATWISSHEGDQVECVARFALNHPSQQAQLLFVILGTKGEVRSSYREASGAELAPTSFLSVAEMRTLFIERRAVFKRIKDEATLQQDQLEKLREDADAIANVSKIVRAEDELDEIRAGLRRIEAAYQDLQLRIAQLKNMPTPLNARKREIELITQLNELSLKARQPTLSTASPQ